MHVLKSPVSYNHEADWLLIEMSILGLAEKSPLKQVIMFEKLFIVAIETLHNDIINWHMIAEALVRGVTKPIGEKPSRLSQHCSLGNRLFHQAWHMVCYHKF